MRICERHWMMMCIAVEVRGMSHLVRTADENADTIAALLEGERLPASNYDPLMAMHWMVSSEALRHGGLYVMGDFCPVCEVMKLTAGLVLDDDTAPIAPDLVERAWIDGPADAAMAACVERGLIMLS